MGLFFYLDQIQLFFCDPALEHTLATFSGQESLLWGLSYIYWSLENILL